MINFGLNSASVLAQVNFGANSASILGIFLAVAGAALYFLRTVRPELSRDQDIFFAAVGLLCGFILVFQGWRLDPILQFGQLLLVGTTVFFAVESIRLRSIATQQAKRNTPIVDDEREVSGNYSYNRNRKKYEAEMDADLEPLPYEEEEERPEPRRIRGSRDKISTRDDYYEDQPPRRSERRNSNNNERQSPSSDRTRRRSSGRPVSRPSESFEDENWGSSSREVDDWEGSGGEVRKPSRRNNNPPQRPESREDDVAPRPRRRRPPTDSTPRRPREDDDAIPTEYVPYNPIEKPNERPDNSTDFDDDV
ncbi:Ycf66 family protein [Nostoc sp. FACHB-973]|uniref:Ycf66 family protein n=1 Tax=Desmonostoc muscorum LEGE 12446 TaxID=1828758 RepID=A0A8J6ZPF7_DESMC|nr:Ycf66 family protein [Desmonostoc muscorum]MBD2519644.1 Ycf66 family protein [Nostoc sp. FACHB-973]MCF2145494.1 Ycf66 family protein [Desmonostoc muscorum LEGE 12446]